MNIANVGISYNQTLYGVEESNAKNKDSISVNMAVNSQDAYIPSDKETYFTYTSSSHITTLLSND